jgi:hypothetical protein
LCGDAFTAWTVENVDRVECSLLDAARIVADFPGEVWDWEEGEYETVDYSTGRERSVCLHVDRHDVAVFALADMIRDGRID